MTQTTASGSRNVKIVWLLSLVIAAYGAARYQGPISRVLGYGAGRGKLVKLQFRLSETFAVTSVAWSPDGRYIATGSTMDNIIDIWDVSRRRIVNVLHRQFSPAAFHEIAWSPNGRYMTFCDAPGVLRVYSTRSWTELHAFSGPTGNGGCTQSTFSSDSSQLALLGTHLLAVFFVPDWQPLKTLNLDIGWGRGDFFNTVAYLPNTHTVLVGGGQYVTVVASGKRLASWDGRVWFFGPGDQAPGRSITTYRADRGGGGPVRNLTVSPDGRFIVTGAKRGAGNQTEGFVTESVHILKVSDGTLVAAPLDRLPPLKFGSDEGIAYTPDGRYIVVVHGGMMDG